MSDTFVVYVRHGEKVLIMQRADEVADFPGAWDGVYGIGDPEDIDAVTTRITECTGIPADALQHVRSGLARGLAFGNRLNDVTPLLFISEMRSPREPFTRITAGLTLPSSGIMNLNPAKVLVLRDSRFHKSTPCMVTSLHSFTS